MSNSDLVTTALATGGTKSFDIATCIGGKCEYPLQQYGNQAKIYTHFMMQTQNQYDPPELNSTLETYHQTNKPNGSKPERSPFDDDASAYFVGDTNMNNAGNGLITFTRQYATIPASHKEPYGLYTRVTPAIDEESAEILASEVTNVNLTTQFLHSDGNYYDVKESGNESDFNHDADTTVSSPSYPTGFANSSNWTNRTSARAKYVFTYDDLTQDLAVGGTLKFKGTYNDNGDNEEDYMRVYLTHTFDSYVYGYNTPSYYLEKDLHISLGYIFTITDKVANTDSNGAIESYTFTAMTQPTNLESYIATANYTSYSRTTNIGISGIVGKTINDYTHQNNTWGFYSTTVADITLNSDGREYLLAGSTYGLEVNSPSNISYRYLKSDDPTSITLNQKYPMPNTLTSTTVPTQQGYRDMVRNNTYIGIENEYIERYIGNIYRVAQIEVLLQ